MTAPTIPAAALPSRSAAELLGAARHGLAEAAALTVPAHRYATAHLAALRAGAALLAARAQPARAGGRRSGPASLWTLLVLVAPEVGEWAAFFAAGAGKRAAAEAGQWQAVSAREADDLLRDAEAFLSLVSGLLGFAHQPALDLITQAG